MTRTARLLVVTTAVVATLLAAGCGGSSYATPTSSSVAPATTVASTTTDTAPASTLAVDTTTSDTAPPAESEISETAVPSGPWPPNLTADEVAHAQAAIAVYAQYWSTLDQAYANPTGDWAAALSAVAAPQLAATTLEDLLAYRAQQRHQIGAHVVTSSVLTVAGDTVTLLGCVGGSLQMQEVDEVSGQTLPYSSVDSAQQTAVVQRQPDGSFKVESYLNPQQVQPC